MWFVSNMYRIFMNCVLLASIALAAPDERHKRHFSYIKDFITSALSSWYQSPLPPFPNVDLEDEYVLYRVPGYEDVLIRAKSNAPILQETDYQPEEVLEINPFESYIGTNNPEETLVAFQNVDNLLSTRVFNSQQTDLLKETMAPIISSLGGVIIAEDVNLSPSRPEVVPNAVEKTKEVKFEEEIRTRYNYRQMENNKPVINFSTDNQPEVSVVEEIDRSSTLPLCLQERIDKVVTLGTDPLSIMTSEQDPYANPLPPRPDDPLKIGLLLQPEYKYGESKVTLSDTLWPLKHLNELSHDTAINVYLTKKADNPDTSNTHIVPSKLINTLPTLGSVPSQYVPKKQDNLPEESKYIDAKTNTAKTIPHFSYKQVNHDLSDVIKLEKEKDSLKTNVDDQKLLPNNQVYTPNKILIGKIVTESPNGVSIGNTPVLDNQDKVEINNSADSGENKNESHYEYKNISQNNLSNFRMTKEKEEVKINANVDESLPKLQMNKSSSLNIFHVNNKNVTEDVGKFVKINENSHDILKSAENETLSEYIHELEAHDNLKPFSIAKEIDEVKTNLSNSTINNVHILSATNITHVLTNESKITLADNVPKKSTLSNYIYEHVAHNTNTHKDSTKLSPQKLNPFKEVVNNEHMSEVNSNITVINKMRGELEVRPYSNNLSTNINNIDSASYTTVKVDDIITNRITNSPENYSAENHEVLIEDATVSFKNNPIVAAESNYVYHQNNADGSSMKIKGNKDGVSIDVSDQNTGRGDIPDQ